MTNKKNNQFESFLNLKELPDDLMISTMTITCSIKTEFNVENIGKYIEISDKDIMGVIYSDDEKYHRIVKSLIKKKKKKKKKKKEKKTFYNQVTLKMKSSKKDKPVNVKLFRNGSIQMTGCKCIEDCILVLKILCDKLKEEKYVLYKEEEKIEKKEFVSNKEILEIENIENVKVVMINSNFNIGFKIDREELYKILLNEKIVATYEPCVHACVNIKYNTEKEINKKNIISIFVFESGAIIITGAKKKRDIVEAYKFITNKLKDNFNKIIKTDINKLIEELMN